MPKSRSAKPHKHQVRIIGGQHRGRRIQVAEHEGLRPTTDRVRETVFNWLTPYVNGARCLDLFAGSGALGLESISRGASFVQFVESSRKVAGQLSDNIALLEATDRSQTYVGTAEGYLKQPNQAPFDIVFLDPPFASNFLEQSAAALNDSNLLGHQSLIYVEHSTRKEVFTLPSGWAQLKQKRAGQTAFALYCLSP